MGINVLGVQAKHNKILLLCEPDVSPLQLIIRWLNGSHAGATSATVAVVRIGLAQPPVCWNRLSRFAVILCTRGSAPFGLAPWAEGCW